MNFSVKFNLIVALQARLFFRWKSYEKAEIVLNNSLKANSGVCLWTHWIGVLVFVTTCYCSQRLSFREWNLFLLEKEYVSNSVFGIISISQILFLFTHTISLWECHPSDEDVSCYSYYLAPSSVSRQRLSAIWAGKIYFCNLFRTSMEVYEHVEIYCDEYFSKFVISVLIPTFLSVLCWQLT